MCLMIAVLGHSQEFPVIFYHNREEFYDRPTTNIGLEKKTGLICGRDLRANGTWMGLNTQTGAFSMLVNVRDNLKRPEGVRSRGEIVEGVLLPDNKNRDPHEEKSNGDVKNRKKEGHAPVAYSMISSPCLWDAIEESMIKEKSHMKAKVVFECSVPVKGEWKKHAVEIKKGVFARSNESCIDLNETKWQKTKFAQKAIEERLSKIPVGVAGLEGAEMIVRAITDVMASSNTHFKPPEGVIERSTMTPEQEAICHTGPFIRGEDLGWDKYGTRCQAALVLSRSAETAFYFYRNTEGRYKHANLQGLPWGIFAAPKPKGDQLVRRTNQNPRAAGQTLGTSCFTLPCTTC
ncbi:hypothetical protein AAMO2058_000950600 [Amorphochlora amoebiformis]